MYGGRTTKTENLAVETMEKYLHEMQSALFCFPNVAVMQLVDLITNTWKQGGTIYTAGNGGSSSIASHAVNDLTKMSKLAGVGAIRCHCLSDNVPSLTAWANDEGYNNVFCSQIEDIAGTEDLVIALSASGSSPNIVKLINVAKSGRATTVGITGNTDNLLSKIVDLPIIIGSDNTQVLEDVFSIVMHLAVLTSIDKLKALFKGFGRAC